jgi:hypothetical protein
MLVESLHLVILAAQNTKSATHHILGGAIPLTFLPFCFMIPNMSSAIGASDKSKQEKSQRPGKWWG